jgi:hypothetical protein
LVLTGATNVLVYTFPLYDLNYSKWVQAGRPLCWCRFKQCKGDADGLFDGKDKDGQRKWVSLTDLTVLVNAWQKVDNATWKANPTWICADFNRAFDGKDKDGQRKWVSLGDLGILVAGWQKVDTNVHFTTNPCFP